MNALPSIRDAQLPAQYVKAKDALATCEKIDECRDWADKAAALASYARQANDDSLRTHAMRIQARAIRRCGELLKKIQPRPGERTDQPRGGAPPRSRAAAAKAANLSRDQQRVALRVASIPADRFEQEVEGDDPPTVTVLAEMGKLPKWAEQLKEASKRPGFAQATRLQGLLREFVSFAESTDPKVIARALLDHEIAGMKKNVRVAQKWLTRFLAQW